MCSGDPRPDRSGVARQSRANKVKKSNLLNARQMALATLVMENHQPGETMPGIEIMPRAHGIIVDQQGCGDFLATPAVVQQDNRISPARHPRLAQPVAGQRAKFHAFGCGKKPVSYTHLTLPTIYSV